jgi:hypothetical protein
MLPNPYITFTVGKKDDQEFGLFQYLKKLPKETITQ